jgi:hypothetical protein
MNLPVDLGGGCECRTIRYKLTNSPLIVHACHCRDCQRLTGGPFVINIWIESQFVEPSPVMPKSFRLTAGTGKPHDVYFCESCGTTLWSRYHIVPGDCLFVRAGTLDTPEAVKPDVHIYTRSKLPWLSLPEGVRAFSSSYKLDEVWSNESKERLRCNRADQA